MLLAKITHALANNYKFRHTEKKDRTVDDFEIIKVVMDDQTEFGQQGSLFCWYGGSKDFDWENYDTDNDWGMHIYLFEFQNFLQFYTAPSRTEGVRKFVLYTPRNDYTNWTSIVIDEIEFDEKLDRGDNIEDLITQLLGHKYDLKVVPEEVLKPYLDA